MVLLVIYGIYSRRGAGSDVQRDRRRPVHPALLPAFGARRASSPIRRDKARIIRIVKTAEILIMLVRRGGIAAPQSIPLMLLALFAMGVHSTFFGPIKYAILPQHLHDDEVLGGTGLVEAGTYIAILGGTLLGGVLVDARCGRRLSCRLGRGRRAAGRAGRTHRSAAWCPPRRPTPERRAPDGLAHRPRLDRAGQRHAAHPRGCSWRSSRSVSSGRWARCWPRSSRRWSRMR